MKIDKNLISLYEDFDLDELRYLIACPDEIQTGEEIPTDDVIAEHLKVINYLTEKEVNKNEKTKLL